MRHSFNIQDEKQLLVLCNLIPWHKIFSFDAQKGEISIKMILQDETFILKQFLVLCNLTFQGQKVKGKMSSPTNFLYAYLIYNRQYKGNFRHLKLGLDAISQGWSENENVSHHHIPGDSSFDFMGHTALVTLTFDLDQDLSRSKGQMKTFDLYRFPMCIPNV